MKVLLVDDSATIHSMLEKDLFQLRITDVVHAYDGREALEKLESDSEIDTVFLDWDMPIMDGHECLKIVRSKSEYDHVRILICTSESDPASVIDSLKSGANDYIFKPFTLDIIREKLQLTNPELP